MLDFVSQSLKKAIRPAVIPFWIRFQNVRLWQSLVSSTQRLREQRSFIAFGVGLPKTGTQSLAFLLQDDYRAEHEPEVWIPTSLLLQNRLSNESPLDPPSILRTRQNLLNLEFESNWTLGLNIRPLYDAFPDAKYILTVRDPISWINSEINQQYLCAETKPWDLLTDYRYGSMKAFKEEEVALQRYNLHPVDSYFNYWKKHITLVQNTVPDDQLLILRTRNLSARTSSIANFLDLPMSSLDQSSSHAHRRKVKPLDIQELVNPEYLFARAMACCGDDVEHLFGSAVDQL